MRQLRLPLVSVLALVSVTSAWGQPQAELVLHFVEIGQGDCTLIQCPNGGFILIDAGSTAHGDLHALHDYRPLCKAEPQEGMSPCMWLAGMAMQGLLSTSPLDRESSVDVVE